MVRKEDNLSAYITVSSNLLSHKGKLNQSKGSITLENFRYFQFSKYSTKYSENVVLLTPSLLMMEAFVHSEDQDQTGRMCSLISDLHCPHFHSRL